MKHTKKILAILLCVTLLLGLAACGGDDTGIPTLEKVAKDVKKNDGALSEKMEERLTGWTLNEFREAWGTGTFDLNLSHAYWQLPDSEQTLSVFFGYFPEKGAPSVSAEILH